MLERKIRDMCRARVCNVLLPLSILLLLSFSGGNSRPLPGTMNNSDGGDHRPVIRMIDMDNIYNYRKDDGKYYYDRCEQMYGFLPCSYTALGHGFLIVVYEYLLFNGEGYVAAGGERVFKILGPGVFGATAFQLIGSLPEAFILLASGLLSDEEHAEEFILTGVGLLAGSSVLLLTVIWGTCVLLSSQDFRTSLQSHPISPRPTHSQFERVLISQWPGYGVVTDLGTRFTARIMLVSAIPLMIIQIPGILGLSFVGERVFVMITLLISIVFLFSYFFYQFFKPWIQRRRLLYIKHEHLVVEILNHVQSQTNEKLLTESGSPNVSTIRRLFKDRDRDGDNLISFSELREFLQETNSRKFQSDKDSLAAEIMHEFDIDNDQKITMDEFVSGMTKWLNESKDSMNKRFHSVRSLKNLYEILQPWIKKKREEREMISRLVPDILEHLQRSVYGSVLTDDGSPNLPAIKRPFKEIDLDKDGCISYEELKELMTKIKGGISAYNEDAAASKIMEELDISGDHFIDEEEFVTGLSKWLLTTYNQKPDSENKEDDYYHSTWEQTDKLIEDKFIDKSPRAWIKALLLLVLGIVMLGLLAEPLIRSVRDFSKAANLSPFYVAFMFVPLATNARLAVSAITEAKRKKLHTTSLTLSEIYGTVFINNILGLAVLLSLIYFRGVSWNFSAEVFMVLAVSAIIGCLASFSTVFPVWTSLLAYLIYPSSFVLVYFLGDSTWFHKTSS